MRTAHAVAVLTVAALLLAAVPVSGQVPTKMNYQVMLTDGADQPLENQSVQLIFRIYDDPNTGSLKWNETHNTTTNSVGVVSVILGETSPLTISFGEPLWLEVEVDTEILSPRRELVASPYALHAIDSDYLGGELASAYPLDAELSTPGSINNPANPVDWTKLKGVPDSFASGYSYSLDADDGSPVDAVYVNASGEVGIGVTNPSNRVQIHRSAAAVNYIQFTDIMTGVGSSDGFEIGTNGNGYAFINQQENLPLAFMVNGTLPARFATDGTVELGDSSSDGHLELYKSGTPTVTAELHNMALGGALELYDTSGVSHIIAEPDITGGGAGFFMVTNGTPYDGFWVEGNEMGDGDASVVISGAGSYTEFDASLSGNSSASLPIGAISDTEILDEPGAGSDTAYPISGLALTGSVDIMGIRTITAPSSGYVLLVGSCQARVTHSNGTTSYADFGVSNVSDTFPETQELAITIPSAAASGVYDYPVTSHGLFPVGAGSNQFYFLGREGTSTTATVFDVHLTVLFIPTAYGTIDDPTPPLMAARGSEEVAGTAAPVTMADAEMERTQSADDNQARIDAELAEMEARIAEIRARLEEQLGQ